MRHCECVWGRETSPPLPFALTSLLFFPSFSCLMLVTLVVILSGMWYVIFFSGNTGLYVTVWSGVVLVTLLVILSL